MKIGEIGFAHVCFQYYETEISKTAPNSTLDPSPMTLPVELCPEKILLFFLPENVFEHTLNVMYQNIP